MKKLEYPHRELIDDLLDAGLIVGSVIYWIVVDITGYELAPKTIAMIAASGATFRTVLRRILAQLLPSRDGQPAK